MSQAGCENAATLLDAENDPDECRDFLYAAPPVMVRPAAPRRF